MSDPEENIKVHFRGQIRIAIRTVAKEMHSKGSRIDKDDFKSLMEIITIERIIPNDSCKPNAPQHEHRVCISVQADFRIRVYSTNPVNKGLGIGCGLGTAAGVAGGTTGGVAAGGALIGATVPVCGLLTLVGSIPLVAVSVVVGCFGGVFAGGCFGACIGAGAGAVIGAADSNNTFMVCASEVFAKFEEYSSDHNTCHCVLTTPTQCPIGDEGPDNENQNDTNTEL